MDKIFLNYADVAKLSRSLLDKVLFCPFFFFFSIFFFKIVSHPLPPFLSSLQGIKNSQRMPNLETFFLSLFHLFSFPVPIPLTLIISKRMMDDFLKQYAVYVQGYYQTVEFIDTITEKKWTEFLKKKRDEVISEKTKKSSFLPLTVSRIG